MPQWSSFRSALVALPVAALMGCGGDGPTGPVNQLSPLLAADAFDALSGVSSFSGFAGTGPFLRSDEGIAFPMPALSFPVSETEPCPVSGTVRVSGSMNINQTTGAFSADIRETYQNCVSTSSSGRQWTFNGSPNVRSVFTFSGDFEDNFSGTGTLSGGFRYSSEGETGRCTIAVTMSFSPVSISVTGQVCGQPVSEQFDWEP
jgi:hypothetical protein